MKKTEAVAEVFITAFRSLPRKEKEGILQKLLDDLEIEGVNQKEWKKIEKLAAEKGSVYTTGKEAKQHLAKL